MNKREQLVKASSALINGIALVVLSIATWRFYLFNSNDPIFLLFLALLGCVIIFVLGIVNLVVAEGHLAALAGGGSLPTWFDIGAKLLAAIVLPCFIYALYYAVLGAISQSLGALN